MAAQPLHSLPAWVLSVARSQRPGPCDKAKSVQGARYIIRQSTSRPCTRSYLAN
jgi:hypothetical protein